MMLVAHFTTVDGTAVQTQSHSGTWAIKQITLTTRNSQTGAEVDMTINLPRPGHSAALPAQTPVSSTPAGGSPGLSDYTEESFDDDDGPITF